MKFNKIITERLIIKESTNEERDTLISNEFKHIGNNSYGEPIFEKISRLENQNNI